MTNHCFRFNCQNCSLLAVLAIEFVGFRSFKGLNKPRYLWKLCVWLQIGTVSLPALGVVEVLIAAGETLVLSAPESSLLCEYYDTPVFTLPHHILPFCSKLLHEVVEEYGLSAPCRIRRAWWAQGNILLYSICCQAFRALWSIFWNRPDYFLQKVG